MKIHNLQNYTEAYKTYNHVYNDKKWYHNVILKYALVWVLCDSKG